MSREGREEAYRGAWWLLDWNLEIWLERAAKFKGEDARTLKSHDPRLGRELSAGFGQLGPPEHRASPWL
jgi:hypothetical protein